MSCSLVVGAQRRQQQQHQNQQQQQYSHDANHHCGPSSFVNGETTITPLKYDWEKYDYYEILDLGSQQETNKSSSSQSRKLRQRQRNKFDLPTIKRAYRTQAQLYHPDKATKNSTQTSSNNNSANHRTDKQQQRVLSKEESNARFARIAEAYQVLKDQTQRQEYDQWLLDCEDLLYATTKTSSSHNNNNSNNEQPQNNKSRWHSMFVDPRQVFEEFFSSFNQQQQQQPPQEPTRVLESREMIYSPLQPPILRIYHTEYYQHQTNKQTIKKWPNQVYVRVLAQEFMEYRDRFHGGVSFEPISQPTLVEEGYRPYFNDETYGGGSKDEEARHTMYATEFMTPNHVPLVNGRFSAGLTSECELIVIEQTDAQEYTDQRRQEIHFSFSQFADFEDDNNDNGRIVWSSGTYVPPSHLQRSGGCFMALQGPMLVVALGRPPSFTNNNASRRRNRQDAILLWNSDVAETTMWYQNNRDNGLEPQYLVRLEPDGSLVVYRQDMIMSKAFNDDDEDEDSFMFDSSPGYNTKAARAWRSFRRWIQQNLLPPNDSDEQYRYSYHEQQQRYDGNHYKTITTCMYATGPAGCNQSGRKIIQLLGIMGRGIQTAVRNIDHWMDDFWAQFLDGDDDEYDDEEFHERIKRILDHARQEVAIVGHRTTTAVRNAWSRLFEEPPWWWQHIINHNKNKKKKKKKKKTKQQNKSSNPLERFFFFQK